MAKPGKVVTVRGLSGFITDPVGYNGAVYLSADSGDQVFLLPDGRSRSYDDVASRGSDTLYQRSRSGATADCSDMRIVCTDTDNNGFGKPEFLCPFGGQRSGRYICCPGIGSERIADIGEFRIKFVEKFAGRISTPFCMPHNFVTGGTAAPLYYIGICCSCHDRSYPVTVFHSGVSSLCYLRVLADCVKQFCPEPFR